MQEVATVSRHVAGLPSVEGRAGGDPSPWTAKGVFESMQVAAEFALGRGLGDLTVAVQGTGNVGANMCRRLADAGARLVIADVNPVRRDRLAAVQGGRVFDVSESATGDAATIARG